MVVRLRVSKYTKRTKQGQTDRQTQLPYIILAAHARRGLTTSPEHALLASQTFHCNKLLSRVYNSHAGARREGLGTRCFSPVVG